MLCVKKPHWMVSLIAVTTALLGAGLCMAQGQSNTTDYIAELNKLGIAGRGESDNAAPFYEKAIELYVQLPADLKISSRTMPKDLPAQEQAVLRKWVQDNSAALEQVQLGSQKSYCWFTQTGQISPTESNRSLTIRDLARALSFRAMLQAEESNVTGAISDIETLYRFGVHNGEGPKLLFEKMVGINIKSMAITNAFNILSETTVNVDLMKGLQEQLERLCPKQNEPFDVRGETIHMQRQVEIDPNAAPFKPYLQNVIEYYNIMATKTPWQLHTQRVPAIPNVGTLINDMSKTIELEYRSRTDAQALITTLAVLRYKSDKGGYPAVLPELVRAGYIRELPADPFSNNPLVYRQTRESFALYSFGVDFDDDGGRPSQWGSGEQGGDQVFWPVQAADETRQFAGRRPQRQSLTGSVTDLYRGFERQAQPGSSRFVSSGAGDEILADANEIKARVRTYEGLEQSLEEIDSKDQLEKSAWLQRRLDNRASLIRVVEEQVKLEMALVRKIATEEKAEKTIKLIDDVLSKRDEIASEVRKELFAQRREQREAQNPRGRGAARGGRGTRGRAQEGYTPGQQPGQEIAGPYGRRGEPDEGEQLDSEAQNKIDQWLQTTLENKETLLQAVYTDVREQYASIRAAAVEEEAKKTTAAIDGILLNREIRLGDIVLRMQEAAEREAQGPRGRNLRTPRGQPGQEQYMDESAPRYRRR